MSRAGRGRPRWHSVVATMLLAALVAVSWGTRFAGRGEGIPGDIAIYFLPVYAATYARIAEGTIPLWNPYQLCGLPWLGTLQGGFFYPLHALYLLLPLHVAFATGQAAHLVLIAIATALFVRRLGLGAAAATLAAIAFTLRGRIPFALFTPNYLEAVAWLPVGAIAVVDIVEGPIRRGVALLAVATGMSFLAGYPQPTIYLAYGWASLLVALVIDRRLRPRGWLLASTGFAAALVLGGMLGAVQLLPALELAQVGTRATAGLAEAAMFLVPGLTQATMALRFGSIVGTPFAFGLAVLALAPAALVAPRRRVLAWWAVGLAIVSALYAAASAPFALLSQLPALQWFRNPDRAMVLCDFAVAIAAAFGLDAVAGSWPGTPMFSRRSAAVVATIALAATVALARAGWAPVSELGMVVAFAALTAVLLVLALVSGDRRAPLVAGALVTLALVEASATPWHASRLPYAAADVARYRDLAAPLEWLASAAGHDRVWRFRGSLGPHNPLKLSTWHRVRAISDYEPLNLRRQADMFSYLLDGTVVRHRPPWLFGGDIPTLAAAPGEAAPATRRRLLDLMAMRFFVIPTGLRIFEPDVRAFVEGAGLVPRAQRASAHLAVFANPFVLPRAFVTYRVSSAPADPDELLAALSRSDFDPLGESYVEGPPPFGSAGDAPRGHAVRFVQDAEAEVELDAHLERPGLVVLADTFYPGWHATVDGVSAPILATNHLFRGVPAEAGTHRVRFVYSPASVWWGIACTGLALAVLGWSALSRIRAGARERSRGVPR